MKFIYGLLLPMAFVAVASVAQAEQTITLGQTGAVSLGSFATIRPPSGSTFTVVYTFSGSSDGGRPFAGPTLDSGGNIYGVTPEGGSSSDGTAYKIKASNGVLSVLTNFSNTGVAGCVPEARVLFSPSGLLCGDTFSCGANGAGSVYSLQPSGTFCGSASCPWTPTALYSFNGVVNSGPSDITFDASGNIFGAIKSGGAYGYGAIYEMTPTSTGTWTYSNIFSFRPYGGGHGGNPSAGPTLDSSGNIYVPTSTGGNNCGGISKISYSGGAWNETPVFAFSCTGYGSNGNLLVDSSGNVFGVSQWDSPSSPNTPGAVWEFTAGGIFNVLYAFPSGYNGPAAGLSMDGSGTLYGTTEADGASDFGNVFKLTNSSGTFTYTDLYDFTGSSDGGAPNGQVTFDSSGNVYGTTTYGGNGFSTAGHGVVWKVTP